ncbi:uncharacterized protein LOC124416993 isoform X1 [Gallus gallus]|uniref:uncharacterized protein LOC124417004 n=1 Tax=Gallus gallus TaxID=9031 RepID=UPI001AE38591|nr:uncharacterized protein LOC124417004 [Gallus gallus]XP_040550515.1 uncharacterized protein LOC124417004 [Gallus gallus]XP_040550516.1 uncharacterized protein LOC124417004 [Gallus gallus]XP_040550517.1 uncharacterized protein LOC124417004 [Gallus gallus]XP_040550593.1 uncharacterized protein LOC121112711 isoform X1 [Gallus gallus]XP_040550594.1 uncharacterized protein LOC121112711 isoform X1 [Gallus gallus]XP_040550595.1 uncharacterized protein LOC121112711 isoform X1 [Gallus gallus]XP_040
MTSQMPWGGAGAVGQRGTCWPHSAGGAGPARSCASGAVMRAQCVSRRLRAVWRAKLVEEELLAHAAVEKCKAVARESLMKDAQKLRAERTAARKEKLKQEKHLVAQLEEQLQAETEEMEVAWRGEGMGAARPRVGTWRTSAAGTGTHAFVCQVLRQEKQHLQEEREELELEGAWQQHQLELEAAHMPGAVLPKLVEAELEKKEQARRRGLAFWMKTICLIFVSLLLLLVAVLGSAVLYAQHYDQELLYRLLLRVLPQAMYASPAYFASRSLRVVCDGLLPI